MQKTQLALVIENEENSIIKTVAATLADAKNSVVTNLERMKRTFVMAFMSQKGGSGKSTNSVQFAVMCANLGFKVRVVDCDVQQTVQHQRKKRSDYKKMLLAEIEQERVAIINNTELKDYFKEVRLKNLEKRKQKALSITVIDFPYYDSEIDFEDIIATSSTFDIVIFDTPCHLGDMQAKLLHVCDSVVIPFNNSDDEFDTNFRVSEFIKTEKMNAADEGKVIKADISSLIIDRSTTTESRNEYIQQLWNNEKTGYYKTHKLLKSRIMNRQIYREVKGFGLGVEELERNQASDVALKEIAVAFNEIMLSAIAKNTDLAESE
ncbi:TPA: ParA family protein [Pseudomonas aeruginosa]